TSRIRTASPDRVGIHMSTQGKLGKDAASVAYSARVLADLRSVRTPIQRSHACSCRVVRVDAHVLLREVGEEDLGLRALAGERYLVLDLVRLHRPGQRLLIAGDRRSGDADGDSLDRDVDGQW